MKLENQVCTKEQAKKLNDLKIAQGLSLFYWNSGASEIQSNFNSNKGAFFNAEFCFSMFTVAELGEMLSAYPQIGHSFRHIGTPDWWHTWQKYGKAQPNMGPFPTEAQARVALLIHLLEKKYLTADEVNARLEKEGGDAL